MQDKNGAKTWTIGLLTMIGALMLTLTTTAAIPLAQQGPTVRIEPVQSTVSAGESFTVSVMIDDASDLSAFQFDLLYITTTVRVDDVTLGDFLGSTGRNVIVLGPYVDEEAGEVTFGAATFGTAPGASGAGELAIISFTAQGEGESPLDLQDVWIADTASDPQEATVEDGTVTVMPTPILQPVGGVSVPVNRLELLASWLGLVAVASLAAVAFAFWVQRNQG